MSIIFEAQGNGKGTVGIVFNAKVGSSTIAHWILRTNDPEKYKYMREKRSKDYWHDLAPRVENGLPESGLIILPVRDPVKRFASAVAETQKHALPRMLQAVSAVYSHQKLDEKITQNIHFQPQVNHARAGVLLVQFPRDLKLIGELAGLDGDVPEANQNSADYDMPNSMQEERIKNIYEQDMRLFDLVKDAPHELSIDDMQSLTPQTNFPLAYQARSAWDLEFFKLLRQYYVQNKKLPDLDLLAKDVREKNQITIKPWLDLPDVEHDDRPFSSVDEEAFKMGRRGRRFLGKNGAVGKGCGNCGGK